MTRESKLTDAQARKMRHAATLSARLSAAAPDKCKYGDPYCPCQDGDLCHYEGANAMTPPALSWRLSLAAPNDWALWREAVKAAFPDNQSDEQVQALYIVNLAERLNRPDLLIAVALSWLPLDWAWWELTKGRAENDTAAELRNYSAGNGGFDRICQHALSPANALGSAALKIMGM